MATTTHDDKAATGGPTSETMDEPTFAKLAKIALDRVRSALDAADPDVVEAVTEADVLKIVFPSGQPYVLNTQRPVREMWLAADRKAWHFRYVGGVWRCPLTGDELFGRLSQLVSSRTGQAFAL